MRDRGKSASNEVAAYPTKEKRNQFVLGLLSASHSPFDAIAFIPLLSADSYGSCQLHSCGFTTLPASLNATPTLFYGGAVTTHVRDARKA